MAGFFNIALERPDELALIDAHRRLTWAEFDERVNRIAHALLDAGIRRGDHIAMLMGNRSELMEVLGAALELGVTVTPVNWHFNDEEVAYVVENCDARALVVDEPYLGAAGTAGRLPGLALKLVTGSSAAAGFDPYEAALEAELIAHCREKVAHYMCPRSVDFEDELPRHTTGKLYKRLLRDKYWQREGRFI